MRDGSPDAAFTAGMYRHGGVVGLRASRHDLRASIQALTAYVRQCDASHVFTSVAVFFNTASPPHRDTQNENTPNLVLKLSSFSGGGLWIEDSCGSVERLVSGKPTLGKILNFQDGKLYVQAREKWHATEPWEGSRVVLVAYNLGCAAQLSADNRTDLCSLGFQPPRSVGDVASPPGDKPTILEVFSGTSRTAAAARRRGLEAHAFDHTLQPVKDVGTAIKSFRDAWLSMDQIRASMMQSVLQMVNERRALAAALAGAGASLLAIKLLLQSRPERFRQVPGVWLLGVLPETCYGKALTEKIAEWSDKYGEEGVFEYNLAGWRTVCCCSWEHAKVVLGLRPFKMERFSAFANVTSLATGSFFSEGERWKRERRILSPAFNAKNVESLIPAVQCVAEQLLQEIEKDVSAGKEVDLTELMPLYTADVICKTGLGHELNLLQARSPDLIDDMKVLADAVQTRMFAPFPYWKVPGLAPWIDDGDKMKKKFDQRAEETMKLANSGGKSITEKLRAMEGDKFTNRELLDNILVLLIAGTDTTSTALGWVFYHLSKDQALQKQVAEEVRSLPEGELSTEQMESLHMVRAVWLETLRTTGPAAFLCFENNEEFTLAGKRQPPGTQFTVPMQYLMMNDPEVKTKLGNDLRSYRPTRWLGPEGIIKHPPFDTLPFGHGPRICLGMRLAEYEGLLAIARVVQKFDFMPYEKPEPEKTLTFTANNPVEHITIRVRPRTW
ncbi:cyp-13A1 [Symbiodinium natans]|uniref:Cyp-13A1 protein n=1 Tax=Symbiodinium natans TaxID=878477 RepID=A0A812JZP3_9DINO|nr:cyp-13A1 [Symbiodinium natans]